MLTAAPFLCNVQQLLSNHSERLSHLDIGVAIVVGDALLSGVHRGQLMSNSFCLSLVNTRHLLDDDVFTD
jgi:hypothetical protein